MVLGVLFGEAGSGGMGGGTGATGSAGGAMGSTGWTGGVDFLLAMFLLSFWMFIMNEAYHILRFVK
jgi:hypothetical protein